MKKSLLGALLALAVGGVIATAVSSGTVLSLFTQATIYAVFALGVGVLLKQIGMVSFGHALFFGGASYLVGILLQLQLMSAELAIAGLGIAHAPRFAVCGALETGALVPLLSGFHSPPSPVSAVYLEGRVLPRKLRALIDFAAEDIRHAGIL